MNNLWWIIILITGYRLIWLFNSDLPIYIDEAYYLYWSQSLEWGYYSKPPVVAAIIALTTALGGESEAMVRIGSLLLYLGTVLGGYRVGHHLGGASLGRWSALVLCSLPIIGFNSQFISTDAPLFFFWIWTLWFFLQARDHGDQGYHWWLLAGVSGGLGLLSKYTLIVLPDGLLLYLRLSRQHRRQLLRPGFWIACLTAVVIFLPNLWWNSQHDWITFTHHREIAELCDAGLHFDGLTAFLQAQFLVMGPLLLGALLLWLLGLWQHRDDNDLLLGVMTLLLLLLISIKALLGEANANWAAPAYLTAGIAVSRWLLQRQHPRLLAVAVGINLLLTSAIYHFHPLATLFDFELNRKRDPYMRVWGWRELATELEQIRQQEDPQAWLLSPSRKLLAYFGYHMDRTRLQQVASWNPFDHIGDHYQLVANIATLQQQGRGSPDQSYLFLSENSPPDPAILSRFAEHRTLARLYRPIYSDLQREIHVVWVRGFQGYGVWKREEKKCR